MNLVEQSTSQAMAEPDDRMMFTQVKGIIARHLSHMDPGATVTKTEFFNHTHVPDMVLEWPGRPRTPAGSSIYAPHRTSASSGTTCSAFPVRTGRCS